MFGLVPGTSRINESEKREPTWDRSLGDPCPKTVFSTHGSVNLNCLELEETHHKSQIYLPQLFR